MTGDFTSNQELVGGVNQNDYDMGQCKFLQ